MDTSRRPSWILGLVVGVVLVAAAPTSGAAATEATPGPGVAAAKTIKATKIKNGVRITAKLEGPLAADPPTRIRTRVMNEGTEPMEWYAGPNRLTVDAEMTDASWRPGEPVTEPDPLARRGLKEEVVSGLIPDLQLIQLYFHAKSVDGVDLDSGPARVRRAIGPGESIVYVHEWDGREHLAQGMVGDVGLPPSGPVRSWIAARYLAADGTPREVKVSTNTSVVGGWDDDVRPDPREVVDAALEDPAFAALMEQPDVNRNDNCHLVYDDATGRWHRRILWPAPRRGTPVPAIGRRRPHHWQ